MDNVSDPVSTFFLRNGFQPAATRALCLDYARVRYGDVHEVGSQGYCSYTVAGDDTIVQFRLENHRINPPVQNFARRIFFGLAPEVHFLGVVSAPPANPADPEGRLYAYSMRRIPGVSLAELRSTGRTLSGRSRRRLVEDFAHFLCYAWIRYNEAANAVMRYLVRERVGKSLRWRLEMMHEKLPQRFRPAVEDVLAHLHEIEALPWVLTHGDVVPGNIMVEPPRENTALESRANAIESFGGPAPGSFRGLLDWAEAEFLPFGVAISSVEELFGESSLPCDSTGPYPPRESRFEYYPEAGELRRLLWRELEAAIPELAEGSFRATVERARMMGILLWHGIAFDDGRLDRVVQEGTDDEEIQRLDAFLTGSSEPGAVFDAYRGSDDRATLELVQSAKELSLEDRPPEAILT